MEHYLHAKRYAKAFYAWAGESSDPAVIARDFVFIHETITESDDLLNFISDPTMPAKVAQSALQAVFADHVHDGTMRMILFLIKKERLFLLPDICAVYQQLDLKARHVLPVTIVSVVPLTDPQKEALMVKLRHRFNMDVSMTYRLDERLIGGIRIHVGDQVIDHSVVNHLKRFKKKLLAV